MAPQVQGEERRTSLFPLQELAVSPLEWAVFLDIGGTLLDLAETPDQIVVPPALPGYLDSLSGTLGGALALVTGRSVAFADTLFSPFQFSVAGLHGAEWRGPAGHLQGISIPPKFKKLKLSIIDVTSLWPGVLVEDKGAAIGVHYRLAPERRQDVEAMMEQFAKGAASDLTLQHGKMVAELRPATANKGNAVEAFLSCEPFTGRRPVVIGDDVTDEAMFRVANARRGRSIRVGPLSAATSAHYGIPSPEDLRRLLEALVG